MTNDPTDCGHDDDCSCHGEAPPPELVFGTPVPPPVVPLRAGPVTCHFDPEWGFLRRFRLGGKEILRAIYPSVRRADWGTVKPVISDLSVTEKDNGFTLTYTAVCRDETAGLDFTYRGTLTGTAAGSVSYHFAGTAGSAFPSNRISLCVLHSGPDCAAEPCSVEHADGTVTKGRFPGHLEPWQPFLDVRSVTHQIDDGLLLKVTCDGALFEMEDQRNWADASFKLYSPPQAGPNEVPKPIRYAAGDTVTQTVRLDFLGRTPASEDDLAAAFADDLVSVDLDDTAPAVPLPKLGTRWAPEAGPLSGDTLDGLRQLPFDHLLIDADLTTDAWPDALQSGLAAANALGWHVRLFVHAKADTPAETWAALATALPTPAGIIVRDPSAAAPGTALLAAARAAFPGVALIAAAAKSNPADLNRERPAAGTPWAIPLCPQVHTFDVESILENLGALRPLAKSYHHFAGEIPLILGPIALRRARAVDPRQATLLTGAWTLGALAALAPTGTAESLIFHETHGPAGLADTPAASVFAYLADVTTVRAATTSDPLRLAALHVTTATGPDLLLLANISRDPLHVLVGDDFELELSPCAFGAVDLSDDDESEDATGPTDE